MSVRITEALLSYSTDIDDDVNVSGFVLQWDSTTGFGVLGIHVGLNGEVEIDTESRGKDFFLDLMSKLYDMAEVK